LIMGYSTMQHAIGGLFHRGILSHSQHSDAKSLQNIVSKIIVLQ